MKQKQDCRTGGNICQLLAAGGTPKMENNSRDNVLATFALTSPLWHRPHNRICTLDTLRKLIHSPRAGPTHTHGIRATGHGTLHGTIKVFGNKS